MSEHDTDCINAFLEGYKEGEAIGYTNGFDAGRRSVLKRPDYYYGVFIISVAICLCLFFFYMEPRHLC